jgi:hypothetical protein
MKRIAALLFPLLFLPMFAQMPFNPNQPIFRQLDSNGKSLNDGILYSYVAGTTTLLPTYTDATGVTENKNPVILDSTVPAKIFMGPAIYKFVLQNQFGVQQWTVDNITGSSPASISLTPGVSQTIMQPPGTTLSVSSLNGVLNAALFPGADLGAKVKNSIAALNGTCGTINIPLGTYTWSTPNVIMKPCQTISGNGAVVNVEQLTQPALTIAALPVYNSQATPYSASNVQGGLRDITFIGPGPNTTNTVGIFLGGDGNGVLTPNTWQAYLINMYDVHVAGFATGIELGICGQIAFFGGSIEMNGNGIVTEDILYGAENMNFHGTQILNNVHHGIDSAGVSHYVEYNLYGVSLDYNGQTDPLGANVLIAYGQLHIFGGHFEGPNLPFIRIPVPGGGASSVLITMVGAGMNSIDAVPTDTNSFIEALGIRNLVKLGEGNTFTTAGSFPASIVKYASAPGNISIFEAEPYTATITASGGVIGTSIPGFTGTTVNEWKYPVFDPYGSTNGMVESYARTLGPLSSPQLMITGKCISIANPNHCGSAAAGFVVVPVGSLRASVATTALKPNSVVTVTSDAGIGSLMGITCNTNPGAGGVPVVATRSTGAFTFGLSGSAPTGNPNCYAYSIE